MVTGCNKMKIKFNDVLILDITETMKKVICHDIQEHDLTEHLIHIIQCSVMHKYMACFDRLKAEWDSKLTDRGVEMIPTNKDKYAELVFSQPDYKSRTQREKHGDRN